MNLHIVFDDLEGLYILKKDGDIEQKKYINISDLSNIFNQNLEITTGELPLGCKYFARKQDGSMIVILERQPKVWDCKVLPRHNRTLRTVRVPLPYLIFGFVIRNGQIARSQMALSQGPITPLNQNVYRMPYGNVYDDYRICWGGQRLPNITNPYQLSGIPELFFEAAFNGDLSGDAYQNFEGSWIDLMDSLNGQETFNDRYLVRNGDYESFKRYLR